MWVEASRERLVACHLDAATALRLCCLKAARRVERDDAARVDDGDAVAQPFGFFDVVRGEQNGALFPLQFLEENMDLRPNLGIEAGGRLVQKNELRIVQQRQSQRQPLLLSA